MRYCKDIPTVNNNGDNVDNGANATYSFHFKEKISGQRENDGIIEIVEIMVLLK